MLTRALLISLGLLLTPYAFAAETALQLDQRCNAADKINRSACWYYLLGVTDGLQMASVLGNSTLCLDDNRTMSAEHMRRVFVKWSHEHPEYLDGPAAIAVTKWIVSEIPCSASSSR